MTLTLLDLYNSTATQEWSMYDNDAASDAEFELSLVLAINKAVQEILYSYPFGFRDRTHIIFTAPNINSYDLPTGLIKQNSAGKYSVKLGSKQLEYIENPDSIEIKSGTPEGFYIKDNSFFVNPVPTSQSIISIDYTTLAIGENAQGEEIFTLKNDDDTITVPAHLEELLKNAIISRTMLNSIASEGDENFSAYKKQSETAYRLLIKYAKGVGQEKAIKF